MLLDPFAGAGGILIEGRLAGWRTMSLDFDPVLRFGLYQLADYHIIGTATMLPLADQSVDAIASEPPYHATALDVVVASIAEMARVIRSGKRIALLVASDQTPLIRKAAQAAELSIELDTPIERKGTSVSCLCWKR
jgi:tRNA G10  N-methylase Trm11